jgi:hypothetical protein
VDIKYYKRDKKTTPIDANSAQRQVRGLKETADKQNKAICKEHISFVKPSA